MKGPQQPFQPPAPDPALRRGLGVIFMLFGALCCVMMAAAALYAEGRLRVFIPAKAWSHLYLAHFSSTFLCGAGYLWLAWRRSRQVPVFAIVDFALGLFIYSALFMVAGMLLHARLVPSWSALASGLFLLYYGRSLRQGKSLVSAPGGPGKPL
jgi:hypothetical protein